MSRHMERHTCEGYGECATCGITTWLSKPGSVEVEVVCSYATPSIMSWSAPIEPGRYRLTRLPDAP